MGLGPGWVWLQAGSGAGGGSAAGAEGAHIQHALQQLKTMGLGGVRTRRQHGSILKFLGPPTAHADQMVVVAMLGIPRQLEAAPAIGKFQFLQQLQGAEQPQGSIHRGQGDAARWARRTDGGLGAAQALVHVFGAEVAARADLLEQGQHPLPLGGEALAPLMQAAAQTLHSGYPGTSQE